MDVDQLSAYHKQRQSDLCSEALNRSDDTEDSVKRPSMGIVQWFWPGEQERVERTLDDMHALGLKHLRTGVSWADWCRPEGQAWYEWLIPRLAQEVEILPCFTYTPPSFGIVPKTSSPPRDPEIFGGFIDIMITQFGDYFEWLQLWNEPNNSSGWDFTLDQGWVTFSQMVGSAANWAKIRGKKTVLGGISPIDPNWLRLESFRAMIPYFDAVAIHGFPGTWDYLWDGWAANVARIREVLSHFGSDAGIWITEVGYSTWRHDERKQVEEFLQTTEAPVDRVYWYSAYDLDPNHPTIDGFHSDEREYHFGLRRIDGTPKLLYRLWTDKGLEAVREKKWLAVPVHLSHEEKEVVITGGAGFIGTNLAHRLLKQRKRVLLFDNLSRLGAEHNLRWLQRQHDSQVRIEVADVRDPFALQRVVERAESVFHLAAQVAVTTSMKGPLHDFEVNARGTINLLEALRSLDDPPPLVFTSTNKVYGNLDDIRLQLDTTRYEPEDHMIRSRGVSEERRLSFCGPYGCSKGAADQYVTDYARIYGLPTVVLRMSCIYGPHQISSEDQGWITHLLRCALENKPITLYGDGMQVRDVLYIDDLVNALLLACENAQSFAGQAFNIGGGPDNTLSLLELLDVIRELHSPMPEVRRDNWRSSDQRYYVSDVSRFNAETGWLPLVSVQEGLRATYNWLAASKSESLFA